MATTRDDLVTAVTREWTRLGAELVLLSQSVADRLKINITDLQCLAIVVSAGPITAGQIAEAAGLTTGAITGVVDRLEKAGLAARESDPADRRRVVVRALPGDVLGTRDPAVGAALTALAAAAGEQYETYSDRELQLVLDALSRAHPVLLEQVSALREETPVRHALEGPPAAAAAMGKLILSPGLGPLTLRADASMTDLYSADAEGAPPLVEVDGGTVRVRPRRTPLFGWGHRSLALTLNGTIPWEIIVEQGAFKVTGDLEQLQLRSFTVQGGASHLSLRLGAPAGTVPLNIQGGASRIDVVRPRGAAVQVYIKGGASQVSIDGRKMASVGGNMTWRVPDADVTDRYDIEVRGGASKVSVS